MCVGRYENINITKIFLVIMISHISNLIGRSNLLLSPKSDNGLFPINRNILTQILIIRK